MDADARRSLAPLAIGIEIGGTKLQAGVGAADGRRLGLARFRVDAARGAAGIRESIPGLLDEALQQAGASAGDVAGIGVGFGGPVDSKRGVTLVSHQIDGWRDFPLRSWLGERWRIPASVQNDASLAGYAEALLGAGRGFRRIFYVTLGSGVGGGLVTGGVIDEGQGLGAGEIGHTWVPDPSTGQPVHLEDVCSGWGIGRRARERMARGAASGLAEFSGGRPEAMTAQTVHAAAEAGNAEARALLDETARTLALGICNVAAILHPERFVIGGGVSLMGSLFWDPLREHVRQRVFGPFVGSFDIVRAELGEEVVVMGGILLGHQAARDTSR
jgi:glucokinase